MFSFILNITVTPIFFKTLYASIRVSFSNTFFIVTCEPFIIEAAIAKKNPDDGSAGIFIFSGFNGFSQMKYMRNILSTEN